MASSPKEVQIKEKEENKAGDVKKNEGMDRFVSSLFRFTKNTFVIKHAIYNTHREQGGNVQRVGGKGTRES